MKNLTLGIIICFIMGCSRSNNSNPKTINLNGNWAPIKQEMGGIQLPPSALANQKLTIADSTYTVVAESVDKGIVKCTDNKMDIYGKEGVNAGKHFTALFKYENEQLTICYNLAGDSYPLAFETKGKPMYFLSVFKKEKIYHGKK